MREGKIWFASFTLISVPPACVLCAVPLPFLVACDGVIVVDPRRSLCQHHLCEPRLLRRRRSVRGRHAAVHSFENIAALWALTFLLICAGSLADIPAPRRCRPLLSLSFWVWVLLSVLPSAVAAASAAVHGMSLCAFLRDPWRTAASCRGSTASRCSPCTHCSLWASSRESCWLFQVLAGLVSLIMAARTWRTVKTAATWPAGGLSASAPRRGVASAPTLLAAVTSLVSLSAVLGVAFAPVSLAILCIQWVLLKARWSVEGRAKGQLYTAHVCGQ